MPIRVVTAIALLYCLWIQQHHEPPCLGVHLDHPMNYCHDFLRILLVSSRIDWKSLMLNDEPPCLFAHLGHPMD